MMLLFATFLFFLILLLNSSTVLWNVWTYTACSLCSWMALAVWFGDRMVGTCCVDEWQCVQLSFHCKLTGTTGEQFGSDDEVHFHAITNSQILFVYFAKTHLLALSTVHVINVSYMYIIIGVPLALSWVSRARARYSETNASRDNNSNLVFFFLILIYEESVSIYTFLSIAFLWLGPLEWGNLSHHRLITGEEN